MNRVRLSRPEKQLTVFVANDKTQMSKRKWEFGKPCICHRALHSLRMLQDFPGEISEDINKWDFLVLYNDMGQHLEELHNSVNQYFQMTSK